LRVEAFEILTETVSFLELFVKIIVIQSHIIGLLRKPELFNLEEVWEAVGLYWSSVR
jgi:hypothetical protein